MDLFEREHSRADIERRVGRLEQVGGVRLVTLADGRERGVRGLEFTCGELNFELIVDRGFDIGGCRFRGVPLGWISPVGVAGPWYAEPAGLGFLRTFGGGLLTTAGLDHALFPAVADAARYLYPARSEVDHGLHGRISATPARLLGYGVEWQGDSCLLYAEGEVEQVSVFGEWLVLRRRVEALLGGTSITVRDEVVNRGYAATPHMFLYHVNVGYPLVDGGSLILAGARAVAPRGDYSAAGYAVLNDPVDGAVEQAFDQQLRADTDGLVSVAVANPRLRLGLAETYSIEALPHNIVWRMLGRTHYVVGLEPSTNGPDGRDAAGGRGELIELRPGEGRRYELRLDVLDGEDALVGFAQRIGAGELARLELALAQ